MRPAMFAVNFLVSETRRLVGPVHCTSKLNPVPEIFLCVIGTPRGVCVKYNLNTYEDESSSQSNLPFRLKYNRGMREVTDVY